MPTKTLPGFDALWAAYPHGTAAEVKALIDGNVNAEWITNTCAIRVSRSFNYAGHPIPMDHDGLNTVRGGDDLRYAFRVLEFGKFLNRKYGMPDLVHEYEDNGGPIPESFRGRSGVIAFDVRGWNDATGHFDLWNGEDCAHKGYFNRTWRVSLWDAPKHTIGQLGGSVGRGGANAPEDVQRVQSLLVKAGFEPGPMDGVVGTRTIAAIESFQGQFLSSPDGRIDPDGRTWMELNGG